MIINCKCYLLTVKPAHQSELLEFLFPCLLGKTFPPRLRFIMLHLGDWWGKSKSVTNYPQSREDKHVGGWPRQFVVAGWNTIIGKWTLCQSEVEVVFVTIFAPFANQEQMCGNIVTDDEEVRDGLTGGSLPLTVLIQLMILITMTRRHCGMQSKDGLRTECLVSFFLLFMWLKRGQCWTNISEIWNVFIATFQSPRLKGGCLIAFPLKLIGKYWNREEEREDQRETRNSIPEFPKPDNHIRIQLSCNSNLFPLIIELETNKRRKGEIKLRCIEINHISTLA